ncbi:MAG: PfkB family carbohydrate kinase [Chloroflexi bacterium]|nr:PfkB family carbohydrate kinase [Chloroflexota bacterium]
MGQLVPEYLVIGHVTRDLIPGNGWRFGGTVTFSALTAHKLGIYVAVLTSSSTPSELERLPQVDVRNIPAENDTVFENVYTSTGRIQYLRSVANYLTPSELPEMWKHSTIAHLGPVAQEVSPLFLDQFDCAVVGVTPQGWLRRWDELGRVTPQALSEAEKILAGASCVVLSLEDLGGDQRLLDAYAAMSPLLVQTRGVNGAIVYNRGSQHVIPAYEAHEVDPTGAGDVFATAFFIRYHETQDPEIAADFANCVASFVVEGPGTSTIPDRDQVEQRLRKGKLRKAD